MEFIFLFLDYCRLSCLVVEEVLRFSDTFFAGSSYELSPALSVFKTLKVRASRSKSPL